ncbi:MAG: pyridoxamine 5'-phosphate oxidase family protein [Gammaproteobacteria bacterium]|nr:pyridoxamine 5'-phosphate oxidase family protein [Gammaproteobacteria bacterium]
MSADYKQETIKYMQTHKFLSLATVNKKCEPHASTLGFASEGAVVYFATDKNTSKVINLLDNPKVAYTIDEDEPKEWTEMQAIQMHGIATVITDPAEAEKAMQLLLEKFPEFADMPPDPEMVMVKIEPTRGSFLDSTVSFGFSSELRY